MTTPASPFELALAHKALFTVSDACGVQVICRSGCLWLTLDGESRDIVLEGGESFLTTEHRRAVIYAMEASSLTLAATSPVIASRPAGRSLQAPAQVTFALQAA